MRHMSDSISSLGLQSDITGEEVASFTKKTNDVIEDEGARVA